MLCHNFTNVGFSIKIINSCFLSVDETTSKSAVDGYLTAEGVACLYLMLSVTIYFNILQIRGNLCL